MENSFFISSPASQLMNQLGVDVERPNIVALVIDIWETVWTLQIVWELTQIIHLPFSCKNIARTGHP